MSEMTGATRLRLFPIMVTGGPDRYLVIRPDTWKILQTTASGIESIKLLRKGLTVDATRAAIGVKYGCAAVDVDMMPLLESLIAADFVEAIDGHTISVRPRHGVWASCWRYAAYGFAQIAMTLVRRAPIGVSTRLVLRRRPSRDPVVVEQITRNMRRVPALARAADDIERQAAENGAVLRGVQHGAIVLLLLDATVKASREHTKVPFLGASLRVARGVAWLASRTSAPVLPISIRGEGTGRYCLEIREPLTELERSTENTTLAALARVLERDVLAQPAAWLKWKDFHIMAEHESWHDEPGGNDG